MYIHKLEKWKRGGELSGCMKGEKGKSQWRESPPIKQFQVREDSLHMDVLTLV